MEKPYIAHELTHVLFSSTFLQSGYDGFNKAEFADNRLGSMSLSEGLANFIPYYILDNEESSAAEHYRNSNSSVCGKNSLKSINGEFDEATAEQLNYSKSLGGEGYGQSFYKAGFCFFKRVENDCGASTLNYLFNEELKNKGSIEKNSTVFTILAQSCGVDTVKDVMTDFGFSHDLLNIKQKNPRDGFDNNLNALGCMIN